MSVVFIIVTNALRDSALSCFGLSDFEQLRAHYDGGLPCWPRRYLTSFFLFPGEAITGSTAMFLARLVCATTVQDFGERQARGESPKSAPGASVAPATIVLVAFRKSRLSMIVLSIKSGISCG